MTGDELRERVNRFPRWYHKIDLGHGVITPGCDFDELWGNIRKTRQHLDYRGKTVLDLGSWDGMWAFEAERLGAKLVVATDCRFDAYDNFLFCREILGSKVIPYYNVPLYDLTNRLDVFFQENWKEQMPYDRMFDVIQHLGLLYHVRDPLYTLSQARSCIRDNGFLIIESAVVLDDQDSYMLFNNIPPNEQRIYKDVTTWWAPTVLCLKEMLRASLFEPIDETISSITQQSAMTGKHSIGRLCIVARAIPSENADTEFVREMMRTYRNPGFRYHH